MLYIHTLKGERLDCLFLRRVLDEKLKRRLKKMDLQDHAYTSPTLDNLSPSGFIYKMNSKEVEDFVKLRVSNNYLFSGRRNSSILAWRAILKHMGLQHKVTHSQASKKWENLKKKYKALKSPSDGVKVFPEAWCYFGLMDDAMEGRLAGNAPILKALPNDHDICDFLPVSKAKKRRKIPLMDSSPALSAGEPEIEVSLNGDEDGEEEEAAQEGSQEIDGIMQEVDRERNLIDSERQVMEKEKEVLEKERMVLQRERAVLDRENAALDRDRASLERERAMIEREKAVMERERVMLEKDRHAISSERLALEQEKARLEKLFATKERTEEATKNSSKVKDSDIMDRKERFLNLFEKLIENF